MPPAAPATSSNSERTGPGHTWVTTTPVPARSARNPRRTGDEVLLPMYAAALGSTAKPAPDPMLSTPPRPRVTIPGTRAEVSWATARMLVCNSWRVRLQSDWSMSAE